MKSVTTPSGASDLTADTIELSLPGHPRHLSAARAVAASLGADLGFDVDEIDDLRLAVDEALSVLLDRTGADDDRRLVVRFGTGADGVIVSMRCDPPLPALDADDLDELAVRILTAVTDSFETSGGGLTVTKRTTRDGA